MLSMHFKRRRKLEQVMSSPAGPYLDSFGRWLEKQGYKFGVIRRHLRAAVHFTDWGESSGIAIDELNKTAFELYGKHLKRKGWLRAPNGVHTNRYISARHFVDFLEATDVLTVAAPTKKEPASPLLVGYRHWMKSQRGVKETTLNLHASVLSKLLKSLGNRPEDYTTKELREFILGHAGHCSKSHFKNTANAARMFLRYLVAIGRCEPGIENAVPCIAKRNLSTLPRYISAEDIERIIAVCDPSTHIGARDLAVILLLARLGLRAGDVAQLQLTDIDMDNRTLVVSGKSRRETRLPLPEDVRTALQHYIEKVRPESDSSRVFITAIAPFTPVSRQAISKTAERTICRSGVQSPSRGAYIFRHSFATSLLRRGTPLYTISALMRHSTVRTTVHYAKVDIDLLKQVATPWPVEV